MRNVAVDTLLDLILVRKCDLASSMELVALLSYGTKSPMKSLSRLKDAFSRQCCSGG
jgi:hypothetical protein